VRDGFLSLRSPCQGRGFESRPVKWISKMRHSTDDDGDDGNYLVDSWCVLEIIILHGLSHLTFVATS
jgi:hypothetical protein